MTTTRMMMMASLALAALTAGLSGTEARGAMAAAGSRSANPIPADPAAITAGGGTATSIGTAASTTPAGGIRQVGSS